MTTFEKIFFWAGIIETTGFAALIIILRILISGEEEKRRQEADIYRGKKQ